MKNNLLSTTILQRKKVRIKRKVTKEIIKIEIKSKTLINIIMKNIECANPQALVPLVTNNQVAVEGSTLAPCTSTTSALPCSIFVKVLGEDFDYGVEGGLLPSLCAFWSKKGDSTMAVYPLLANVIQVRINELDVKLLSILNQIAPILSSNLWEYRCYHKNRQVQQHAGRASLLDLNVKPGDEIIIRRKTLNALLGGGNVLQRFQEATKTANHNARKLSSAIANRCLSESTVVDDDYFEEGLPLAETVPFGADQVAVLIQNISECDDSNVGGRSILLKPANHLVHLLRSQRVPTLKERDEIVAYAESQGKNLREFSLSLLADSCAGKSMRLNAMVAACTEETEFKDVKFPEGVDQTTSARAVVRFRRDVLDSAKRIVVDGIPLYTADAVNATLQDRLTHSQASGIDAVDHEARVFVDFINFEKNFQGLEITDFPGAVSLTIDKDEAMQREGFKEGVAMMLVRVDDRNSSILNLAKRTPKLPEQADRVIVYTQVDKASEKDLKDAFSPHAQDSLKKLVAARQIIRTSKDDCSSFLDLAHYYYELHWKKLFFWYCKETRRAVQQPTARDHLDGLFQERAINGIDKELGIIFGKLPEHDDFVLSRMELQPSAGSTRGPAPEWVDLFNRYLSLWMDNKIKSIMSKNTRNGNVQVALNKLPVFESKMSGLTVPSIILEQSRKLILYTQSQLLQKSLNYFFLQDREEVVSNCLTSWVDDDGSVHAFSVREQEYVKTLYIDACQLEIRECVRQYEAQLSNFYEGFVRHCVQSEFDKLKGKAFPSLTLVQMSHKLFYERAIVQNPVCCKSLIHQAIRNVPVRIKDRLTKEMESARSIP